MKKMIVAACALAAIPLGAYAYDGEGIAQKLLAQSAPRLADNTSPVLARQLAARWEKMLREVRGWDDGAMAMFRAELASMPSDTLQKALETRNWDTLQAILLTNQGEAASARLAQAVEAWRSGDALDETNVEDAQFKRSIAKSLGDADKDLIYVPIQPCTTWDTRFATLAPHAGQITASSNRPGFVYHSSAGAFNWSPYGGNPSCTDTAVVANYGVIPYAVAYTLYTANATANGWVTAYRDGDPDPSSATISLYYVPGPTLTTTAITRVGRAVSQPYDIRVASQFGSVDVAVSVIGYFIKSGATALDCTDVTADLDIAAGVRSTGSATCAAGYTLTGGGVRAGINDTQVLNASSPLSPGSSSWFASMTNNGASTKTYTFYARCCRVPGR